VLVYTPTNYMYLVAEALIRYKDCIGTQEETVLSKQTMAPTKKQVCDGSGRRNSNNFLKTKE
jgi:hypothetical protein